MKPHTKNYFDYYGIDYDIATGYHDYIDCEVCRKQAVDIHHIQPKGSGGSDQVQNIIALCRDCHTKAHAEKISKQELIDIHYKNL